MATLNDIFARAALGAWCMLATGCGEAFMTRHERLERAVAAVSLATEEGRVSVAEHGTNIVRVVLETPQEERAKALEELAGLFLRLGFDERSYSSRSESMKAYTRLVAAVADGLRESSGVEDDVWKFRLAAADRVNVEIERCEREPKGGPYGDVSKIGMGQYMTQRFYCDELKYRRFRLVFDWFEMGAYGFSRHFIALPAAEKAAWQTRLENVAHRRVVVWNSKLPTSMIPRYEAEDTREWLPQRAAEVRRASWRRKDGDRVRDPLGHGEQKEARGAAATAGCSKSRRMMSRLCRHDIFLPNGTNTG